MMKKIVMILALVATLHAKPADDWYVGIGYIGGDGERTVSSTVTNYDISGADVKVGVIFENNNRFEFSWSSIDTETASGSVVTVDGRELDWIFTSNLNNKDSLFLPFLLVGVGSFEYSDTVNVDGVSAQAGFGVYLNLDLEVEISYKNKIIKEDSGTTSLSEDMAITYVGVKYKF
jgi:hypothetical protein